jgi:hypothetical protein
MHGVTVPVLVEKERLAPYASSVCPVPLRARQTLHETGVPVTVALLLLHASHTLQSETLRFSEHTPKQMRGEQDSNRKASMRKRPSSAASARCWAPPCSDHANGFVIALCILGYSVQSREEEAYKLFTPRLHAAPRAHAVHGLPAAPAANVAARPLKRRVRRSAARYAARDTRSSVGTTCGGACTCVKDRRRISALAQLEMLEHSARYCISAPRTRLLRSRPAARHRLLLVRRGVPLASWP